MGGERGRVEEGGREPMYVWFSFVFLFAYFVCLKWDLIMKLAGLELTV